MVHLSSHLHRCLLGNHMGTFAQLSEIIMSLIYLKIRLGIRKHFQKGKVLLTKLVWKWHFCGKIDLKNAFQVLLAQYFLHLIEIYLLSVLFVC